MHAREPSRRIRVRELFDFAGHLANGALDIFRDLCLERGLNPFRILETIPGHLYLCKCIPFVHDILIKAQFD